MKQQTLAGWDGIRAVPAADATGEVFSAMELVVPWADMVALIEPRYPKGDGAARRWTWNLYFGFIFCKGFNLSVPAVADTLYDSVPIRSLAGIDLGRGVAPDEMTECKFHHLLEQHGQGVKMLSPLKGYLE